MNGPRGVRLSAAALAALLVPALVIGALVAERMWPWCPVGWDGTRVELSGGVGDVTLDGRSYRVGANALLDHMPRISTSPWAIGAPRGHPLGVIAESKEGDDADGHDHGPADHDQDTSLAHTSIIRPRSAGRCAATPYRSMRWASSPPRSYDRVHCFGGSRPQRDPSA